jgi:osmotically-inducible protein OsmY
MAVSIRSDEEIQRDVLAELKWDMRVQPNEVGVSVKDGIVTLTGWVDSYVKRWAAEEAALRVHNVKAVANDIEVRLPGSAERTDPDLAAAVVNALKRAIRHLSGIRGITNLIAVRPSVLPSDLKQKIEQALVRNAETDARNIRVEVEGSKVILRGTVRSYAEWKAAGETARSAPGVTDVENHILISYP